MTNVSHQEACGVCHKAPCACEAPDAVRCRVTGVRRCQCVGCWPNWPNPAPTDRDLQRAATLAGYVKLEEREPPADSVRKAIAFIREQWRGNDGAEGDAVRIVCAELDRLRDIVAHPTAGIREPVSADPLYGALGYLTAEVASYRNPDRSPVRVRRAKELLESALPEETAEPTTEKT